MNGSRPAYVERKRELERARREALRTHAQPCVCPFCMSHEMFQAMIERNLSRERERIGEAPF